MALISLFVPTIDRSSLLLRLLTYYKNLKFEGPIVIGDSSHGIHLERNRETVESLQEHLDLVYLEYPGLNGVDCAQQLISQVSTPFAAFMMDDDFMVPSTLDRCIEFLEGHPDFSAAHGASALISVEGDSPYGRVRGSGYYRQPSLEEDTASRRLAALLGSYSVIHFSVLRTETWQRLYRDAPDITEWKRLGGELLQSCLSAVIGKVKSLDSLQTVRQVHDSSTPLTRHTNNKNVQEQAVTVNMSSTNASDEFDWLTGDAWLPSYESFRELVSEELVRQDGISLTEANAVVKQAFWSYLVQGLTHKWHERYDRDSGTLGQRMRSSARVLPGVRRTWHAVRSFLPRENNKQNKELSLGSLLRPSSPYHADFMPIYRALTTPVETISGKTAV